MRDSSALNRTEITGLQLIGRNKHHTLCISDGHERCRTSVCGCSSSLTLPFGNLALVLLTSVRSITITWLKCVRAVWIPDT